MRKHMLLALVLFAHVSFAAEMSACNLTFNQDYYTISAIGLVISILLLALRYMLGMLFASPDVEASVKVEVWQIVATLGILIFIPVIPLVLCSLDFTPQGIVNGNSIAGAKSDLMMRVKSSADVYLEIADLIHEAAAIGTMQFGFYINKIGIFFSPFGGYATIAQLSAPLAQSAITTYFASVGYYTIYVITQSKSFLLLIPIGISLRCFPITRKIGGTLLAVGIGLVYIFPLIVSISSAILPPPSPESFNIDVPSSEVYFIPMTTTFYAITVAGIMVSAATLGALLAPLSSITGLLIEGATLSSIATAVQFSQLLGSGANLFTDILTGGVLSSISDAYTALASIVIPVFFMPALELIVVSSVIRSLSSVLGSEIDISGVFRVV
ncbi:MAG: hypothetical protein ACPL0A_02110 [Candidatus Micrarchaeia archaeon]